MKAHFENESKNELSKHQNSQRYQTWLPAHAVARVAQLSRLLACRRTHPHVIAGLQQ